MAQVTGGVIKNTGSVILAKEDETISTADARNVMLVGLATGALGALYLDAKRVAKGKDPYLASFAKP